MKTHSTRHTLLGLGVLFLLACNFLPFAAHADFTLPDPVITIPGVTFTQPTINTDCAAAQGDNATASACYDFPWIGQYLSGLYIYAVYATAVLAAIVIMIGGFLWLTAGGNANQVSSARNYISGAVLGFALMLGSYTILRLVNPDLVVFNSINIPIIARVNLSSVSQAISGSTTPTLIDCTSGALTGDPTGKGLTDAINSAASTYNLDPFLLLSILKQENGGFDPALTYKNGQGETDAYGLGQMLPTTAASVISRDSKLSSQLPPSCTQPITGGSHSLYQKDCKTFLGQNPQIEIQMTASYLNYIRSVLAQRDNDGNGRQYENDLALVSGSYNQGEGNGLKMIYKLADPGVQAGASRYFQGVNLIYHDYCGSFP